MNNKTEVFEREGKGISEPPPSASRALERTVQVLEGYFRDPPFDPKYGAGFGKTENLFTGYGI